MMRDDWFIIQCDNITSGPIFEVVSSTLSQRMDIVTLFCRGENRDE